MADNADVENIYDEIEIDDMDFDEDEGRFTYPCPCGDKFQINIVHTSLIINIQKDIVNGLDIGTCPSCSLQIKIIFDEDYLRDFIKEKGLQSLIEAY